MKKNVTAAGSVPALATKVQLELQMVKQNCFVKITATVWATASLPVQQMPFLLQKRRQLLTTKPQFWKIRKSWKHTPSFNSGRYRLSQFLSMLHILTMLTFLLLQTAQPMLTLTSIRILSKVRLLLSAVRNWTLQITAKSSPKSSVRTISRVLPSCVWKFHAAAESRMQP